MPSTVTRMMMSAPPMLRTIGDRRASGQPLSIDSQRRPAVRGQARGRGRLGADR